MLKKWQLTLLGDGGSPEPALATGPALAGGLQPCVQSGADRRTAGWWGVRCRDCLYGPACVSTRSDPAELIYSSLTFQVSSASVYEVGQQPFVEL